MPHTNSKLRIMAKKTTAIKYSEAIQEIEHILEKFRNEQLDVDKLASEVKRASELITACKKRLKEVEEEVANILEK